jgi:hypothetical protein
MDLVDIVEGRDGLDPVEGLGLVDGGPTGVGCQ